MAQSFPGDAKSRWHKYLEAYQHIHDEDLLDVQEVTLRKPLRAVMSKPQSRAICQSCGEEIMNEREIVKQGRPYCTACRGQGYYVVEPARQVTKPDRVKFSPVIIGVNG
jgi:formylmethanofuran dehydrogenase subunit E